jgi:hypothetical protein
LVLLVLIWCFSCYFVAYLTFLCQVSRFYGRIFVNNELKRLWKKVVVAYFKVLYAYLHWRTEKVTKASVTIDNFFPEFQPGHLQCWWLYWCIYSPKLPFVPSKQSPLLQVFKRAAVQWCRIISVLFQSPDPPSQPEAAASTMDKDDSGKMFSSTCFIMTSVGLGLQYALLAFKSLK